MEANTNANIKRLRYFMLRDLTRQNYDNSLYKFLTFDCLIPRLMSEEMVPYGEPLPSEYETLGRDELKSRLTVFIEDLLNTNFEKLCNMIYRHDVAEHKFNAALQAGDVGEQAEILADLVIERELQKVETRRAYRKYKDEKRSREINAGERDED